MFHSIFHTDIMKTFAYEFLKQLSLSHKTCPIKTGINIGCVLIGLHQNVCVPVSVCVWHIQHSNCVSLVGQWGIEVLNPILNLYLSYRGGGDVAQVPTICHGPQFRGIEYGWETTQGPGVATGSRFRLWGCSLICYQIGSGAVDSSAAKLIKIYFNEDKTDSMALSLWVFCYRGTQYRLHCTRGWPNRKHSQKKWS